MILQNLPKLQILFSYSSHYYIFQRRCFYESQEETLDETDRGIADDGGIRSAWLSAKPLNGLLPDAGITAEAAGTATLSGDTLTLHGNVVKDRAQCFRRAAHLRCGRSDRDLIPLQNTAAPQKPMLCGAAFCMLCGRFTAFSDRMRPSRS